MTLILYRMRVDLGLVEGDQILETTDPPAAASPTSVTSQRRVVATAGPVPRIGHMEQRSLEGLSE